jgi:hypothetical protein
LPEPLDPGNEKIRRWNPRRACVVGRLGAKMEIPGQYRDGD